VAGSAGTAAAQFCDEKPHSMKSASTTFEQKDFCEGIKRLQWHQFFCVAFWEDLLRYLRRQLALFRFAAPFSAHRFQCHHGHQLLWAAVQSFHFAHLELARCAARGLKAPRASHLARLGLS